VVAVSGNASDLPGPLQARVNAVWMREQAARPGSFDGPTFAIRRVDADDAGRVTRIEGAFVPYSRYLASRRDADVAAHLAMRAMGVTGVLLCDDGVVVGRRAASTTDGGLLELAPAGTLDATSAADGLLDLRQHVLVELAEELGLSRDDLTGDPLPFALVEDLEASVADLGLLLRTHLSPAAITTAAGAGDEHTQIAVLTAAELRDAGRHPGTVVTTSLLLLDALEAPGAPTA
jgi:hypothetical protein